MTAAKRRSFQRACDSYLRHNHGDRLTSGRLTPRQRRRLRHHYPDDMALRAYELAALGRDRHGDPGHYARRGWF